MGSLYETFTAFCQAETNSFISNVKKEPSINLRTSFNTIMNSIDLYVAGKLCLRKGEAATYLSGKFITIGN